MATNVTPTTNEITESPQNFPEPNSVSEPQEPESERPNNMGSDAKNKSIKRGLPDSTSEQEEIPKAKVLKVDQNTEELPQKDKDMSNKAKCPVCFELPRAGPIFGCRNGHHTCQRCLPKLKQCAICRDTDLKCRQLFIETYLENTFKDRNVKCKHDHCNVEGKLEHITEHENLCVAREIPCPMSFRGVCEFRGHMREFLRHIRDAKCCQMLIFPDWKRDNPDEPFEKESVFQSHVGDNKTGNSVLDRIGMETVWKPTLFLSKKILTAGMACLFISRHPDRTWKLIVQALVPKEIVEKWTVTIEVSDFKKENAPIFSFKGRPVSYELSAREAFETGHVMTLHDDQIRPFKKADTNHLFDYRIKFELNPEFENKCLSLVNGKFTLKEEDEVIASGEALDGTTE